MYSYLAAVFIKENRTCAVLLQLGLGSFPVAVTALKPVFSNRRYKEYQGKYLTYVYKTQGIEGWDHSQKQG